MTHVGRGIGGRESALDCMGMTSAPSAAFSASSPSLLLPCRLLSSMASLAPPNTTNRNRASSTNIRPALTLNTLGRRRSNSDLPPPAASPVLDISHSLPSVSSSMHTADLSPLDIPPATPAKSLARASFVEFYARVMDMLRVAHKEAALVSTPSSPRLSLSRTSTSTDETLLPIASPSVATFSEAYAEKPTRTKSSSASWWHGSPSVRLPYLIRRLHSTKR